MKSLSQHINEKLVITNDTKIRTYKYTPTSKDELKELIAKLIEERGNEADLNDIDTSKITNMSSLFKYSKFNGDISNWNVSNVEDMSFMFSGASKFNGDLSGWDVSNVKDMYCMFSASFFNGDISNWKISKGCNTDRIFYMGRISKCNKPKRLR